VRALTRKQPKPGTFPGVVEIALGDLGDPVSVAEAIKGADELFLLIGNVADEFTQARTAYGLAKKAGLKHVTYLSVFKADQFFEVHFAAKYAVEEASRAGSPSWPAYDLRAMYQGTSSVDSATRRTRQRALRSCLGTSRERTAASLKN
jgi:uncharacterized protein YbjT (DUF2867 family)